MIRAALLLGLLALCAAQVTPPPGFVSQTEYVSCTQFEGVLDCGPNYKLTVLSISLLPGTGNEVTYRFQTITNTASSSDTLEGPINCPFGSCTVTDEYEVVITSKPLVVYYQATPRNQVLVPYFYSAHHTNAYAKDKVKGTAECGGKPELVEYENAGNAGPGFPGSQIPAYNIGA